MKIQQRNLLTLSSIVIFCLVSFSNKWIFFFSGAFKNQFADLRLITSNAECLTRNGSFDQWTQTCDPWNRITNYGTIWVRLFSQVGINESHTFILGLALGISTILIIRNLINEIFLTELTHKNRIVLIVVILSTPVFMILERGNNDQIILILLFATFKFLKSERFAFQSLGIALLSIATYLKLFTFGAGLFLAGQYFRKREYLKSSIVLCSQLTAIFLLGPELIKIMKNSPTAPNSQFGIRSTPSWIVAYFKGGMDLNTYFVMTSIAGFAIFIGLITAILFTNSRFPIMKKQLAETVSKIQSEKHLVSVFGIFGGSFVAAFFAGSNWFYRLILLIPLVFALLCIKNQFGNSLSFVVILVFSLTAVGPTPFYLLSMQLLTYFLTAYLVIIIWHLLDFRLEQLRKRIKNSRQPSSEEQESKEPK